MPIEPAPEQSETPADVPLSLRGRGKSARNQGNALQRASTGTRGTNPESPDDGTRALLHAGLWIAVASILALIATITLFGGIGIDGPHTNAGWLCFMFAMMGIPFGLMLLALGIAKWLRKRRLRRL